MDDTISKQAAIDEVNEWIKAFKENGHKESAADAYFIKDAIKQLPSAQPYTIHSDGRLWITVDDIDKVTAVVVDEHKSKFCKQFYEDYEEAQPEIIYCKNCKHWIPYEWMFSEVWQSKNIADYPEDDIGCDCCEAAMKANDFCSRAVRREVTT